MSGDWHYPDSIPRVTAVAPLGEDAVTLTLNSGELVTVPALRGVCIHPDGLLLTDCYTAHSAAYFIPSPALVWEVVARLGLNDDDAEERQFNHYLLGLGSIVEAVRTDDALTLAYLTKTGERRSCQFSRDAKASLEWNPSDFTRYPMRVFIHEGEGDDLKIVGFRIDHMPEGYAALAVLGWEMSPPALEGVRSADLLNAAD